MEVQSTSELNESFSESCIKDNSYSEEDIKFNIDNQNATLEKRLSSLKEMMENLGEELTKEKELWKKEVEEAEAGRLSVCSSETPMCSCCEDEDYSSQIEPTLNDISILDYEQKLSVYQQALAKAHAEKRMHLRKHLAANAYKRRLMELENMCNLELLKVKQNVQTLQPLRTIVSEWHFEQQENPNNLDDELTGGQSVKKEHNSGFKDVASDLENFSTKISSDIKELSSCLSPAHSSAETSSSLLPEEDEDTLMMRRLQSVGWYWYNDKNNYPFNPLM